MRDKTIIGAIVQARMSSNRYPGKVLYEVKGKPLLQYILESLSRCKALDAVVVATSTHESDDAVEGLCRILNVDYYRGPLEDVAGRFLGVLNSYGFNAFVRVNGDSPLIDYRLVDKAVSIFRSGRFDVVTNILKKTFPRGQSVEVLDGQVFKKTYPLMSKTDEKEHVTPYFYKHHQGFSVFNFEDENNQRNIQLSVDTREDMNRFEGIVDLMNRPHWEYTFVDILKLIR